jgi:AraC-like DNA-binding protein
MRDPELKRSIVDLVRLIASGTGDRIEEEQALFRIAAGVAQHAGRFDPGGNTRNADSLLVRAKDYIDSHAGRDLSLDDISRAANLSKFHFLRLFRRQFGITPHKYVLSCRVNAARAALEAGEPLDDVVYRYRFADLSHFNRRFKRIYGMTPRQYQRSIAC